MPIRLSNIKENNIVRTTVDMIDGRKNRTRNTPASGIFLYMKNAETNASGRITKSFTTKNNTELTIALPITLPGDENDLKNSS